VVVVARWVAVEVGFRCPAGHSRVAELARSKNKLLSEMLTEIADRGTRNLEVQLAWCCPAAWGIIRAEMWARKRRCYLTGDKDGRKGREVRKSSAGNRSGPDRDGGRGKQTALFNVWVPVGCASCGVLRSLPRPRQGGGKQRAKVRRGAQRTGVRRRGRGHSIRAHLALWWRENRKETRTKGNGKST
jgi:hypothetical protein